MLFACAWSDIWPSMLLITIPTDGIELTSLQVTGYRYLERSLIFFPGSSYRHANTNSVITGATSKIAQVWRSCQWTDGLDGA